MKRQTGWLSRFAALSAIVILGSACGAVSPAPTAAPPPTLAPTLVPPTATASPIPPTATASPIPPTETPLPTPDVAATAAAEATAAMQPVIAKIDAELKNYGLSTAQGHLGWVHDPVTINLKGYWEEDIETDYPDLVASDYVMQADITWNTTTGVAGCGFILSAAPDFDHGNYFRFNLARFGPLWDLEYYKAGQPYANVTGLRDALPLDDGIDSTNTITVIVQGIQVAMYANGQELDTVSDGRMAKGTPAFIGWQESGKTSCTFENGWLWVLKD